MLDIAIIGGGAAGCSAGITARMRGMEVQILTTDAGSMPGAHRVDNYPGLPNMSGADMLAVFRAQAEAMGAPVRHGLVRTIMPMGDSFSILLGNDILEARAIILTTGAKAPKRMSGEAELLGRGVSQCATCDGMFYRGKRVAVVAETADAVSEANFLAEVASEVLYYARRPEYALALNEKIRVMDGMPDAILGEDAARAVRVDGQEQPVDGVFIFRDAAHMDALLPGLEFSGPFVRVDAGMRASLPGVFAAGDITGKPWQIAKAVGEGNLAALSASEYVQALKKT